jgi:hypothetical protein
MRKAVRWIAVALVAVCAVLGSINAYDEFGDGETLLQKSVGVAVLAYAICSWLILYGVARHRAWTVVAALLWAASTTYAATVSSFAWGGAPVVAVIAAGASCLLLGWWVVWAVRDHLRVGRGQVASSPLAP